MTYACLKNVDGRKTGLRADWEAWFRQADILYERFLHRVGDSPFYYHEVAAVGFLASAAAMAGFTPLAEYALIKRGQDNKRAKVDGRADFWFSSDSRAYSFEFKRAYFAATSKNLHKMLLLAKNDIARIQQDEYNYAAGGLIAFVSEERRLPVYEGFAEHEDVDFACRIGPEGEQGAFLYFKLVSR